MRKFIVVLALASLLSFGGCRAIYGGIWQGPKWLSGKVLNVYTGNGHYDGKKRWDNFAQNWQRIWNFIDVHIMDYDIRDPYLGAPFFGDPR